MTRYRRRLNGRHAAGAGCVLVVMLAAQHAPAHHGPLRPDLASMTPVPGSYGGNEALANAMAASGYGWAGRQTSCLDKLWMRESTFRTTAVNGQTGATGIPQLNPNYHAIPAGWSSARVQVGWGLSYISGLYGSPCAAWSHEEAVSWY